MQQSSYARKIGGWAKEVVYSPFPTELQNLVESLTALEENLFTAKFPSYLSGTYPDYETVRAPLLSLASQFSVLLTAANHPDIKETTLAQLSKPSLNQLRNLCEEHSNLKNVDPVLFDKIEQSLNVLSERSLAPRTSHAL